MLKTLEKSWPIISILLIIAILASLFFWPSITQPLSLIVMGAGLAAIITFTIQRHVQAHREGKITRQMLARNLVVDVLGILVTMTAVIASTSLSTSLVAGKAGAYVGQAAGRAWGVTAGVLSSLVAGLVMGFGVSLLVRWGWGKLTKPRWSTDVESAH